MPYKGQMASKASHSDIVRNPDVNAFLSECRFLKDPDDEEIKRIIDSFDKVSVKELGDEPLYLIATDGSYYEASVNVRFPSTKIAYVKFGTILVKLSEYRNLAHEGTHLLDPFKVATLENNNRAVTLTLPSSNVTLSGKKRVTESFRYALDQWFKDDRTQVDSSDPESSLIYTLAALEKKKDRGSKQDGFIRVHKCPTCNSDKHRGLLVPIIEPLNCPGCGAEIYSTDSLRLWEELSEYQSNTTALGRLMMMVEHLLPVHYIRYLLKHNPKILGETIFFIDGPLALFGTAASFHKPIMEFLFEANSTLAEQGIGAPLVISLQKTGQVVDFVTAVEEKLERSSLLLLSDNYRYNYILNGRKSADICFGDETYYGQDFIFKTDNGSWFVFALPYPEKSKRPVEGFVNKKERLDSYPQLEKALSVIQTFESDLYSNAVVPIALAHKYTSISLSPGGKILDFLSRSALNSK